MSHGVVSDAYDEAALRKASSRFFRRELALSNSPPTSIPISLELAITLRDPLFKDEELEKPSSWEKQVVRRE